MPQIIPVKEGAQGAAQAPWRGWVPAQHWETNPALGTILITGPAPAPLLLLRGLNCVAIPGSRGHLGFLSPSLWSWLGKKARVPLVSSGHAEQPHVSSCGVSWLGNTFGGEINQGTGFTWKVHFGENLHRTVPC